MSTGKPEAIIIAGPNGAGKSTLAYAYQEGTGYPYVSADLIAAELSPERPEAAQIQAGRQFVHRLRDFAERRESFIAETTLSGKSFLGVMQQLQAAGYETRIAFVFLDTPALCLSRIQQRVLRGGHDVPAGDVYRRFGRSMHNFWHLYRPLCNHWHLFYNAAQSMQEVALGDPEGETVVDELLFERFRKEVL